MSSDAAPKLAGDVPPQVVLLQLATAYWASQALYVAARLDIADRLRDGPSDIQSLAARAGVDARALHRVLRALSSLGVFVEIESGRFGLTSSAELLRSDLPGSMRAQVLLCGEEQYRVWGDLLYSVETGKPAFEHVYGMPIAEYLDRNPTTSEVFQAAKVGRTGQIAQAVAAAYDFGALGSLVEVGGGLGIVLSVLLRAHPNLHGTLFDAADVVRAAEAFLEPLALGDRCRVVAGDMFAQVPQGADAYLLASVIHYWEDDRAAVLLGNCRRAMPDHGRLLLVELVIPPGNSAFFGKFVDLNMLVVPGGRERTEIEHRNLLRAAGLRLNRIIPVPSEMSLIEAVPE